MCVRACFCLCVCVCGISPSLVSQFEIHSSTKLIGCSRFIKRGQPESKQQESIGFDFFKSELIAMIPVNR